MKYIVMKVVNKDVERELPILFPDALVHKTMAQIVTHIAFRDLGCASASCVAAGFISSAAVGAGCYGESESLGIESRGEEDDKLIGMLDYNHGIRF